MTNLFSLNSGGKKAKKLDKVKFVTTNTGKIVTTDKKRILIVKKGK